MFKIRSKIDSEILSIDLPESIESSEDFNSLCRKLIKAWNEMHKPEVSSDRFKEYLTVIEEGPEHTIKTEWGGVYITKHEHPEVEKYLIVRHSTYLAFEKHDEKFEQLDVEEGVGIVFKREGNEICIYLAKPGFKTTLEPGVEHCIIALEDLIVFETSKDYKGMDQDLIFIFEPSLPY